MAQETRGRTFEEFEIGAKFESPGRTITESDVVAFAGVSGDYTSLHTDAEFARGTPHGRRIAHGLLGVAVASGLAARVGIFEGTILALKSQSIHYLSPIYFNDTVHLILTVVEKKKRNERSPRGLVTLQVDLTNQDGKIVTSGNWECMMISKPA